MMASRGIYNNMVGFSGMSCLGGAFFGDKYPSRSKEFVVRNRGEETLPKDFYLIC